MSPTISRPSPQFVAYDPEFWKPKPAEVKLIKLDLDKYGSKEGRERLLSRWENEVFKAPK